MFTRGQNFSIQIFFLRVYGVYDTWAVHADRTWVMLYEGHDTWACWPYLRDALRGTWYMSLLAVPAWCWRWDAAAAGGSWRPQVCWCQPSTPASHSETHNQTFYCKVNEFCNTGLQWGTQNPPDGDTFVSFNTHRYVYSDFTGTALKLIHRVGLAQSVACPPLAR